MIDPVECDALFFPPTEHEPRIVRLATSAIVTRDPLTGKIARTTRQAHPEVHLNSVWEAQSIPLPPNPSPLAPAPPSSRKSLTHPYVIYFPTRFVGPQGNRSPPLYENECIRAIRERRGPGGSPPGVCWKGGLIVAKYSDVPFGNMIKCSAADMAIISAYLATHPPRCAQS